MKCLRIELLVWLVLLLPCLASSRRTPRGFRSFGRKPDRHRNLQPRMKDTTVGDGQTLVPTSDEMLLAAEKKDYVEGDQEDPPTGVPLDPKEADVIVVEDPKVTQKFNDKADKNTDDEEQDDDNDQGEDYSETEAPTFNQTIGPTLGATGTLTSNEFWVPATTEIPVEPLMDNDFEVQQAAELTDAPTPTAEGNNEVTDSPTIVETLYPTLRPTLAPTSLSNAATHTQEEPTHTPLSLEKTQEPTVETQESPYTPLSLEKTQEPTVEVAPGPYSVGLPPLYFFVTMKGMANEKSFLDLLVAYMTYYMDKDFQGFQSVSYGATLFSMITKYPSLSKSSLEGSDEPTSNITSHLHLLTATFDTKPRDLDWEIKDYMEMLLEDEDRMQDYVELQPDLDFTILSTSLEFEDTVPPTNVQAPNAAKGEESEEEEKEPNLGKIIGGTVGAFIALLWVVILYGIQSRETNS